jgi:hypothetical protein
LAVPPGAARCAPHKPDHPLPCAPLIVHHDELPVAGGAGAARGVGGSGAAARAVQAAGQSLGRADLSLGFRVSGFPSPPPPPPATASAGTPPAARPPPGPPGPTATLAFWWDPLTGRYTPTLVTQYEWRPGPGAGTGPGTRAVAAVCPPVATLLSTNAVQVASAGVGRAVDDPTSGSTGVPGPSESPTIMKPVVPLTPRTRAPPSQAASLAVAQAVTCSLTTQTPSPSRTSHPGPTTGSTTGSATGSAVIPPVKPAPVHAHWQAAIAAPGPGRVPGPRAESGGLGLLVDSDNLNVTVKRPRLGHRDSDGPARDGAHTDADWPGVVPLVPTGRLSAPGDLARVDRDHWRVQVHVQREAHTAASTTGSHGANGTMPQAGAVATASCAATGSAAGLTRTRSVSGAAATPPADSDTLSCPYCPYQTAVVSNVSSICA